MSFWQYRAGLTRMWRVVRALSIFSAMLACGCADSGFSGEAPTPDYAQFQQAVYPVLLRDCGFAACHGDAQRFLLVMGPGRTRFSADIKYDDPPTDDEIRLSYERARSLLSTSSGEGTAPLLLKPLSSQAGGVGHKGFDALGRNVYQSKFDPSYQVLVQWAATTMAAGVTQ